MVESCERRIIECERSVCQREQFFLVHIIAASSKRSGIHKDEAFCAAGDKRGACRDDLHTEMCNCDCLFRSYGLADVNPSPSSNTVRGVFISLLSIVSGPEIVVAM